MHQAVDNEPSDCGPSNGSITHSAAVNRTELSVPSGGTNDEAFDAAAGDANTRDHPARVAVPLLMMVTDEEAPIPFSHVSSAFEDGDKKLLANARSEQTSGEVDAIDETAIPSSSVESTPSVNSVTEATIYADDNSSDDEDAINNVALIPQSAAFINDSVAAIINDSPSPDDDADDNSSDSSVEVTIQNQEWPVEGLSAHTLPTATLIPIREHDDLIFEAVQVDKKSLPWFKKSGQGILLTVLIAFFLSASLAVAFILLRERSERSSSNNGASAKLGITLLPAKPSSAPSTVPCNTYRLTYRGILLDSPRTTYPYVDIDGNDAVVGTLLSGELFFFSNVMEEGQTRSNVTSLDLKSVFRVGISNGVAVAGASIDNSRYTVPMFEKHDNFFEKTASSWNQTIEFHNNKDRPGLIDIDGDVVVVSDRFDVTLFQTPLVHVYRRVNSTTLVEEAQITDDVTWKDARSHGVSVRGDLVVVGIPNYGGHKGAVFVYRFNSLMKSWNQFHDPIINDECDMFGYSVILLKDGGLLIGCGEKGNDSGAVYFYSQQQDSAQQHHYTFQQKIVPDKKGHSFARFNQLAADGNILLVLSTHLHVYAKENMTWTEVDRVSAPVRESKLGMSVAISGRKALVSSERNVYAYYIQDC
ncbi:hypothetical protein ACHAWO_007433 [Cyclotella atomus]|uniref:Uncharacterized protein n=1 Tax=Cyclotella atomus TaxID=382360 RepID=A0ABD3PGH2_9STRA